MESLAESVREQPAMPRLEDGSMNLRELMRRIAEADQLCAGGANNRQRLPRAQSGHLRRLA